MRPEARAHRSAIGFAAVKCGRCPPRLLGNLNPAPEPVTADPASAQRSDIDIDGAVMAADVCRDGFTRLIGKGASRNGPYRSK